MYRNITERTKKVDWESVGLAFSARSERDGPQHPQVWPGESAWVQGVHSRTLTWWDENLSVPTVCCTMCVISWARIVKGYEYAGRSSATVCKTVAQDTQFQTAVHFNVIHIVFYIRFCTYLLHTSLMQSSVIAGRLFCYWLLDPGKKQNSSMPWITKHLQQ